MTPLQRNGFPAVRRFVELHHDPQILQPHFPRRLRLLVIEHAIGEGQSARIRVEETYTDPVGYVIKDGELVWTRTLGRPLNYVTLPAGWMLTSVNTPAVISLDDQGRTTLRFTNPRNDELSVTIKARQRTTAKKP